MFKKLIRTMLKNKGQFISMIIMVAIGLGVFVGFNLEWYSMDVNSRKFSEKTHMSDYIIINESGFTEEDLSSVKGIEGVENAGRFMKVDVDLLERKGDVLALSVTENWGISDFIVSEGDEYDKNSDDLWLGEKYAKTNEIKVGEILTLKFQGREIKGRVAGLVLSAEYTINIKDKTQIVPDYDKYGFVYMTPSRYEREMGMAFYPQINILSKLDKDVIDERLETAFNETLMLISKDQCISYSGIQGEIEEGKTMAGIVPALFLAIAFLTQVTTMQRITDKERGQIGILKAMGMKNSKIILHYVSYGVVVGIIGGIIGIGLGYLIGWSVFNPAGSMSIYIEIPEWKLYFPKFAYWVFLALELIPALIGFIQTKWILKYNASELMRGGSEKPMKHKSAEKLKIFHKMPFGFRWNMRDVSRHKARTFMSIFGVVGSVLIIVCTLGMYDTMQCFLDEYYDGSNQFVTRVYIADDATNDRIEALKTEYGNETSSSYGVKIDGKSYSLDIYDVEKTMKFLDPKGKTVTLGENGAYLSKRVSKATGCKKGDWLEFKKYGSLDVYKVKVEGIVCSVTESIVMSNEYAESVGIAYRPDSIYSMKDVSSDNLEAGVFGLQSKSELIDTFNLVMQTSKSMLSIFAISGVALGIIVLYNLGVMNYTERYRELATLKVLGFENKKLNKILMGQMMFMTVIGIILGLVGGVFMLDIIIRMLMAEYEMRAVVSALSVIITILISLGVTFVVGLLLSKKHKKINMVESLGNRE